MVLGCYIIKLAALKVEESSYIETENNEKNINRSSRCYKNTNTMKITKIEMKDKNSTENENAVFTLTIHERIKGSKDIESHFKAELNSTEATEVIMLLNFLLETERIINA